MSDATSALYAFGMHEEIQAGPDLPFFLAECRKRLFARIYTTSMATSIFLGRPPQISRSFSCLHIPLDLEDRHFELSGAELSEELTHYDENGWNTSGEVRIGSLFRLGMLISTIREDLLELLLGRNPPNFEEKIVYVHLPTLTPHHM